MATSRFKKTEELKTISLLMTCLYKKEIELAKDANLKNDANSIDSKKYAVVSGFIDDVNKLIIAFNDAPEPEDTIERLQQIVIFSTALKAITTNVLEKHTAVLEEPRNDKRKHANLATQIGMVAATGIFAVTQTFATGVAAIGFGYQGSILVKDSTGMTDSDPQSFRWIKGLDKAATNMHTNVSNRIASLSKPAVSLASPRM